MLDKQCMLLLLFTLIVRTNAYASGNNITFENERLNRLWNDETILGDSTLFNYPVDAGTTTRCDRELYKKVFNDTLSLNENYSHWDPSWTISERAQRYYFKGYAFYESTKPLRRIEKNIYSNVSCIHACITEKDFNCRSVVYFHGDGGVCALYDVSGQYKYGTEDYFNVQESADFWKLFKKEEPFRECDVPETQYAHPHFALGWKAMEAGWYSLANNQLDKAIQLDPDFYMAYVGKVLSQPNLGYGLRLPDGTSYADLLKEFKGRLDWELKLGFQQRLIFKAVLALLQGEDLGDGLKDMKQVFADDTSTVEDYMIRVLDSNCLLLIQNAPERLASQAQSEQKVFALRYLTYNLNPYKEGKDRINENTQRAAVTAVYTFERLKIKGASHISTDCIDIAEYYGEFNLAYDTLDILRNFLFVETAPGRLYKEDSGRLVVDIDGVNIDLIGVPEKEIDENERLHFYQVQTLRLVGSTNTLSNFNQTKSELIPIYRRMVANHFFSLYDFYNDGYASQANFTANLDDDFAAANSGTPLDKISYAYFWTAVAISDMRSSGSRKRRSVHEDVLVKIEQLKQESLTQSYKDLIEIYDAMIKGYSAYKAADYNSAYQKALEAGSLNERLQNSSNFVIPNDEYSQHFKMLIPIGSQFKADMLRNLYQVAENGLQDVNAAAVTAAYRDVTQMVPLNTTRALLGYAKALMEQNKNKPKKEGDEVPEGIRLFEQLSVKRWAASDIPEEENELKKQVNRVVDEYYEAEPVGCRATQFQVSSVDDEGNTEICWGGFVIIGVCIAIVVIIVIIIGILCLRRKATAPARDKDKEDGFVFTGPNLNCSESGIGTPSYAMGSLSRDSHMSDGPYMSQTLDMKRKLSTSDYTQRSNTLGAEKLYMNNGSYGAQL